MRGTLRRIGFARWRSGAASGGNRYDDELLTGLRALGLDVRQHRLTGPWPLPTPHDQEQLAEVLTAEPNWLLDNIVGSAAPGAIRGATRRGGRVTLLVHYFPTDDPALSASERRRLAASEADAVGAASAVVVTSAWAAAEVAARYGRADAVVAVPGVDPAPLAHGSAPSGHPPALLWLGRLTVTTDPLPLLHALGRLTDLPWTARLVGPDTVDPAVSRQVQDAIANTGLSARVEVPGARSGAALEPVWAATDLLVHTSLAETYGMVVSEALARGVPSIVASGTGAVEAQAGVGAVFTAGDAAALAEALGAWLVDPVLRERWRDRAALGRLRLPTWHDTAVSVASALPG